MTSRGRTYTLRIVGDVKDASQSIQRMEGKLGGFMGAAKGLVGGFIAAEVVQKVVAFGTETVTMASDVEQSVGAVESIFKGFSDEVISSAESAAGAVGLSEGEYLKLASTLGGQLKNAGVPLKDIAGMTDDLIAQGADLAATYGGTTTEAVEALGSAMRGEADPAERYALNLKQSALSAEAAEEGITASGEAMTDQERIMALLSLTSEQGADAMGAFAREGDTLAGKQQRLSAQFDNVKTALGERLLPIVSGALDMFQRLVAWITENWPRIYSYIAPVVKAVQKLLGFVVKYLAALWEKYGPTIVKVAQWIGEVIGAAFRFVAKVLTNVIDFVRNVFSGKWKAAFQNIKNILQAAWDWIMAVLKKPIEWLRELGAAIAAWVSSKWRALWSSVREVADNVIGWFRGIGARVMGYLRTLASNVTGWVTKTWQGIWDNLKDVALTVWNSIGGALQSAWDGITGAISVAWDAVVNTVKGAINIVIDAINGVTGAINSGIRTFNKLPGPNVPTIPAIPRLARGGVVTGPTVALLGERGPEAVVPLRPGAGGGAGSSVYVTINVPAAADPYRVGRAVVDAIRAYEQTAGSAWRTRLAGGGT